MCETRATLIAARLVGEDVGGWLQRGESFDV